MCVRDSVSKQDKQCNNSRNMCCRPEELRARGLNVLPGQGRRRIDDYERRECQKGGGARGHQAQAPREREACRSRLETAMHAHPECGCGRGPGNISARVIAMPSWPRAPPACVCRPRAIFLSPSVEFSSVPSRNRRIVLPACAPRLRGHRPTCMPCSILHVYVLASSRSYM